MGILMKWMKKCPLLVLLLISGLFFTAAGAAGKQGAYSQYPYAAATQPLLSLAFQGWKNGVSPWQALRDSFTAQAVQSSVLEEQAEREAQQEEAQETGNTPDSSAQGGVSGNETERALGFVSVSEDYFDDALFIGDSRTVGLKDYAGLKGRAEFYCQTSLTIWNVLDKPIVPVEDERKEITVEEALGERRFGKIYLMVGINELGRGGVDSFMEQYEAVTARIRELQPDALIFVEGIMRVSKEKNDADPIFNNANINLRNERIAALADGRSCFYIDVNEAVCDEEGNLNADYTNDGVHLKAAYYGVWKDFLLRHGVGPEGE